MFSTVLGLFSIDLAVDLGTSNTRIYSKGQGPIASEPSVLAVRTDTRGRRAVLALGDDARPMIGRTPVGVEAVQPVRHGQIQDYDVAEALLVHMFRRVHGRNKWMSPRLVVTMPSLATEMERRAVRECCEAAGAREVHFLPSPLASALGAGLPVDEPSGHMIVDVGGGSTQIAIVSLHGVVTNLTVPGGGEGMDEAIVQWMRDRHGLLIGRPSAEALKIELGTAVEGSRSETAIAKGRCLEHGIPKSVRVDSAELEQALQPCVREIDHGIRRALEQAPPELASDIVDHGVVLTGGGCLLRDLDTALRNTSGLPVIRAEDPLGASVIGAGIALEEQALLRAVAC